MNKTIPATKSQVQFLHGLYRALNWDQDTYRGVLDEQFGVESTVALSIAQANELIQLLKAVVGGYDFERITAKQVALIRHEWLSIDYSNGQQGDLHLNAFTQKRFKKAGVDKLTKQEAIKFLNTIKAMQKQAKAREGKTTVINKLTTCNFCGAPIMWVQLKSGERVAFDPETGDRRPETGDRRKAIGYVANDFHKCISKAI